LDSVIAFESSVAFIFLNFKFPKTMKQLVKVYLMLLSSLVYSTNIQGQNINTEILKKQKESAVYFASGSSELSSKAMESLNTFLQNQPNLESTEFRLQAFTDDVGSPERNTLLAKSRAIQVQEYLSKQEMPINTIKIQAFQQLHLNPDESVVEQRANNRRVVVELWGVSLKKSGELE
jgi:outer membrane protein OmpA-like peptidoglycan-associated protein